MTTTQTVYNFGAGPAMLPADVMRQAQADFLNYADTGYSIVETSHRSKQFVAIIEQAEADLRELMNIPDDYAVLFMQGGASHQFAMIPMNFLGEGQTAEFIDTGSWSSKAIKEAKTIGDVHVVASTKADNYNRLPTADELNWHTNPAYTHYTTNNTIFGTQYHGLPATGKNLVADMSSDIMWQPVDVANHAIIYAGAQKNIGPSGLAVVIMRKSLLEKENGNLPAILKYSTHADANSLYNTAPTFSIYLVSLVTQHLKAMGGLDVMKQRNEEKAGLLYDAIDNSGDFYRGSAALDCRSRMNVTFRVGNEEQETAFLAEAEAAGLKALKGHRSVGGVRASIYNAMPIEGVQALVDFMADFKKKC